MENIDTTKPMHEKRITHKLKEAGMPERQAECIADIFMETSPSRDLLTRQEFDKRDLVYQKEFAKIETRFAVIETRLDGIVTHMDTRFAAMETRLDAMETSIDARFAAMETSIGNRLDSIETHMVTPEKHFRGLMFMMGINVAIVSTVVFGLIQFLAP